MTINIIDVLVGAIITFFFGTVGGACVNWLFNRTGRKAEIARRKAEEERNEDERQKREREREELLAEARSRAQQAALDSANAALATVRTQCDDCTNRLGRTEQRLHDSEERERKMATALRTIIRVMDENDPTEVTAAINAARELV